MNNMAKGQLNVNHCCPETGHLPSRFYSKRSEENMDMIFTLAENVRCMQRGREDNSLSRERNGPSRSTEMWKSGRLRDGSSSRNKELQRDLKESNLPGCIKRNMSQTVHQLFPSMSYWKTFLFAVLLCVFLKSQMCSAKCYGLGPTGRAILTDLQGFISDHPNESYPISTECEWLIQAPNSDMKIMLTFSKFATECGYDFVSVYDGNSHQSPMIAALSGDSIPSTLMAESGQMLIYMYSDRNYNLLGFDATYTIEDCPHGCSGHGTCVDYSCVCYSGYHGDSCERLNCPYECGSEWNQGSCQQSGIQQCACSPGFVGEGCSLSTNSNLGWGETFLISSGDSGGLSKRAGHASVYHEDTDSLWTFGGIVFI
ncbi:multiple epidermal growth factor-like domains protein 8 [Lytechinus pictus]|uniref:multiple epidermal growth factor-like domains protein 8 n=1 Tax=Lytechinus pictus TaxID=7653 RepID=UPI0030B9F6C7